MSTASSFRGLVEVSLSLFAIEDPNDPFVAAYPTFRTFTPPGSTAHDELVLLRRSAASAPTARQLGNMPNGLSAFSEDDIPAVFRALNPANLPGTRGFPTFVFGQSGGKNYMDVVTLRPSGFTTMLIPTAELPDPSDVEAFIAAAQAHARALGLNAALPTFNVTPAGHEVLLFSMNHAVVNSSPPVAPGVPVAGGGWSFKSPPVINEGGLALCGEDETTPLLFNVYDDGKLVQWRTGAADLVNVDPFVDGSRTAPGPIDSQISAVRSGGRVHVLWSYLALFHGSRQDGHGAGIDAFTFRTASGRTAPEPTGLVGYFNTLAVAPDDVLHALAYLSVPPGVALTPSPNDAVGFNLLHLVFDGASWSQETVDGEAATPAGHVVGNMGQSSALAFEPDGTAHAFYELATTSAGQLSARLRHAEHTATGWMAETLDGSGAAGPPAVAGTGPTRGDVGVNPTAVFFDGALWVIYEDRTWGNLRCARGKRDNAGVLKWDFHVVDGNSGPGRTTGTVQTVVAVLSDNTLSLFYADLTRNVIRHAWRYPGESHWHYEILDGSGGPDGRINTPTTSPIAACAIGRLAGGAPTRPVLVAYRGTTGAGSNIRVATLM